jgi:Predicted membrane protein
MIYFALRAAGMYFLALLMIRVLGKRALGELGPFDFVVMTGVGHTVVSVALDKSIPYYEGIVILFTLAVLEYLMGFLALKSQRFSDLLTGRPVVLIDNGRIIKENLAREKFNIDDLLQELRKRGLAM